MTSIQVDLGEHLQAGPLVRGGTIVLRGTRMPVSVILANVAAGMSLDEIAEDFDLDKEKLVSVFRSLAMTFSKPIPNPKQEAVCTA